MQALARISLFGRRRLVGILKAVGAPHPTAVDVKAGVFLPAPFYAVAEFSDFRLDASCLEKARALLALQFVRAYDTAGSSHCGRLADRGNERALGPGSELRAGAFPRLRLSSRSESIREIPYSLASRIRGLVLLPGGSASRTLCA